MNAIVRYRRRSAVADKQAVEIGVLYKNAKGSFMEVVRSLCDIGEKLSEKKAALGHGEWLVWLDANANVLGFGERTARLLMKGHAEWAGKLTSDLTETEALEINRLLWGNARRAERVPAAATTAVVSDESPQPTTYDRELERLRRAWSAAGTEARREFLCLVNAENVL